MPMKSGSHYGRKGMAGAYGMSGGKASYGGKGGSKRGGGKRNPLKGRAMPRGPKDVSPSHRGYAM